MEQDSVREGWRSLFRREWIPTLTILLGGVLLQSMNVLLLTTVLPSIVGELGGVAMLSWPTTAYLASSIVAASCAGVLAAAIGPGQYIARASRYSPSARCFARWPRRWAGSLSAGSFRDSAAAWRLPLPMCWSAERFRSRPGHGPLR